MNNNTTRSAPRDTDGSRTQHMRLGEQRTHVPHTSTRGAPRDPSGERTQHERLGRN